MKRTQFELLETEEFEESIYHLPLHSHTYYELIYIKKGSGLHLLNNARLTYGEGDLFLVCPGDEHRFEIGKRTRFCYIKFTDHYFSSHRPNCPDSLLVPGPQQIMRNRLFKEVKLKMEGACATILKNTVENIMAYDCRTDIASSPLICFQILSIFGLVLEAAAKLNLRIDNGQPDREELISYIHQHIYRPNRIQIKQIASHFNIAPSYFSDYFRKNFKMGYRSYVNEYRTKLIEKRLCVPELTIRQIASEFGFVDDSHFTHFFKSMRNITPSEFRKHQ